MALDVPRLALPAARRAQPHEIWAVVLAAGESHRMGRIKALHPLGRDTFLERILRLYRSAGLPVCVVLGSDCVEVTRRSSLNEARVLRNPQPGKGPLSSLQLVARTIQRASGLIVHPVDHPLVAAQTVERLRASHRRHPSCILIPTYGGRKGHPVLFPRRLLPDLQKAPLDVGARWVVRKSHSSVVRLETGDEGILANLNTPEQFGYWSMRLSTRWGDRIGFEGIQCWPRKLILPRAGYPVIQARARR